MSEPRSVVNILGQYTVCWLSHAAVNTQLQPTRFICLITVKIVVVFTGVSLNCPVAWVLGEVGAQDL